MSRITDGKGLILKCVPYKYARVTLKVLCKIVNTSRQSLRPFAVAPSWWPTCKQRVLWLLTAGSSMVMLPDPGGPEGR